MFGWNDTRSADVRSPSSTTRTLRVPSLMRPKGDTDPGVHAQVRHQAFRRCEAQFAVANLIRHRAQVGAFGVEQDHQVVTVPLLIAQKQILAVRRVDARPVPFGLVHGGHRRVLVPLEGDPELRQPRRDHPFVIHAQA